MHVLPTFALSPSADCPAGTCGKRVKGSTVCRDAGRGAWSAGGSSSATTLRQALGGCLACRSGLATKPNRTGAAPPRYMATKPTECGKLVCKCSAVDTYTCFDCVGFVVGCFSCALCLVCVNPAYQGALAVALLTPQQCSLLACSSCCPAAHLCCISMSYR